MTLADSTACLEHAGCSLAFGTAGSGAPVLFIQGVGVHGPGWQPQTDALSQRFHCLWFDNRGVGRSLPLTANLTIDQMAQDALALMDAQGWDSAHLVGHSMGGLIAMNVALAARRRVRSLSLLCTFANGKDVTRLTPWLIWVGLCTRLGPRRTRRRAFLEIIMPKHYIANADQDALAQRLAPIFGHDLADQPAISVKQLAALSTCNVTSRLAELQGIPTLVVSATHDRIAPPQLGQAIARGIPGARYAEIPDGAHGVTIQSPAIINSLLLDHISRAGPRPPS